MSTIVEYFIRFDMARCHARLHEAPDSDRDPDNTQSEIPGDRSSRIETAIGRPESREAEIEA